MFFCQVRLFHFFLFIAFLYTTACKKELNDEQRFTIAGGIETEFGTPIVGVKIYYTEDKYITSDENGKWEAMGLRTGDILIPIDSHFDFEPQEIIVTKSAINEQFLAVPKPTIKDLQIAEWFNQQQLPNGLLESTANSNFVSLYDNALAAMVFMVNGQYDRAALIFDFFNGRIENELQQGPGGFSQFRYANGQPTNHRWMGDNGWLLMALNNYKAMTGLSTYDHLANEISNWLKSLQDSDGGLFAGYDASGNLLNYKVTEGNIDAFNAVKGYGDFHQKLLGYLEQERWDAADRNLVAWPENPQYLYALDVHSWSYCCFEDYPSSALSTAERFLNTQTFTLTNAEVRGYCFDEDRDVVWLEGTAQMALAFRLDGQEELANFYLNEMDKAYLESPVHSNAGGFSYSVNQGSAYGADPLWSAADQEICISSGAWYVLARKGFNPFALERNKNMPESDKFWLD